jgi:hypothetical protein
MTYQHLSSSRIFDLEFLKIISAYTYVCIFLIYMIVNKLNSTMIAAKIIPNTFYAYE